MNHRDPLTATLLSLFVPFYILYWYYDTGRTIQARGVKVPPILMLVAPVVGYFVFFIFFFISIFVSTASGSNQPGAGFAILGLLFPLVMLAVLGFSLFYYYKFGEAVEQATHHQASGVLLFILFWLVAPAGVYIAQEKLNFTIGQPPAPQSPIS